MIKLEVTKNSTYKIFMETTVQARILLRSKLSLWGNWSLKVISSSQQKEVQLKTMKRDSILIIHTRI